MTKLKPVVLCVLDGWGYNPSTEFNAIEQGKTPFWHEIIEKYPTAFIKTSGLDVGLPEGQMGNSEVGHTNLGAGRVVMQDLPRINEAVRSGALAKNPVLIELITKLKSSKGVCHLMGLIGPGGVHAYQTHIIGLANILADAGIQVTIHAFLDGRDTPPDSARGYMKELEAALPANAKIATVSGRYYAMDRDNRWERVTLAYDALVNADGNNFAAADEAIKTSYDAKVFDEFVIPCTIGSYTGMKDGDGLIMANFRPDRAREITKMLLKPDFAEHVRSRVVQFIDAVAMTEYSEEHNAWMKVLFPGEELTQIFGEIVSNAGLTQLRIAETEKYAHVTFFFNGGQETLFKGEERILVPSPKVATYDLQPEMSAIEVTDKLVGAINSGKFDTIIVNYANGDMVGHTGVMDAAIAAVECVDACLKRVVDATLAQGGAILVTADHGNAEMMRDPESNAPFTAHTTFPVKAALVGAEGVKGLHDGRLSDIAPTLLELMGIPQPAQMTGVSLLEK